MQRLMYQVIAIVFLVGQLILSPLSMIQASAAYAPEVAHDGTTIDTSADIETTEATDPEIESDPASDTKEGEPNQSPENEQTTEGETQAPNLETPGEEGNDPAPLPETVDDEQKLQDESSSEEATEDETEEENDEDEDEDRTAQDEVSDGQLLSAGQLDFHFGSMVIGNATVTDAASAENVRPKSGESVTVNYNFKLNTDSGNAPIQKGDYFTFQLPQALLVFDQTSLSGTIGTPGAMFNYKTDGNGQVTVTSLQEIKTGQVTGNLTFGAHFSLDGASNNFEQNLEIPIQGKETITIPLTFYPSSFEEGIKKTGKGPEGEPTGKDDLIDWTVHINPSPASTESVKVTDKLSVDHPSGAEVKHEYAGLITITKYKLDVHGNKEEVSKKTAESFPLTLEKEEGPYVFELTYQTKVNVEQYVVQDDDKLDSKSKYTFKNSVTYNGETATDNVDIFYEDEKPDLPLTKSVSTKAGDDSQLRYSYEVVYNKHAKDKAEKVDKAERIITDTLTKGSELYTYDKESFKIFERSPDGAEVLIDEPEDLEGLTINDSSFTYEIPEYYENDVIVIRYDVVYKNGEYFTETDEKVYENPSKPWEYHSSLELENKVAVGEVNKELAHKNKEQQYLKKSVAEIDYVNQEIKWTIHGKVPKGAKEFTIEDTFKPKEEEYGPHTLVEGSFELNGLNATIDTRDNGFTILVDG
ncbi:MAG TPA: hypothetical protein VIG60_03875, partial [Savagea sp.]